MQKLWKQVKIDPHQLTNTTLALSNNNNIANCNIILTILQSLIGFNQLNTTLSTKTLGNEHIFVKSFNFESNDYISMRNFHEQQNFQLKPNINCVYDRDLLFQFQKVRFICSIQQQNQSHLKFL